MQDCMCLVLNEWQSHYREMGLLEIDVTDSKKYGCCLYHRIIDYKNHEGRYACRPPPSFYECSILPIKRLPHSQSYVIPLTGDPLLESRLAL